MWGRWALSIPQPSSATSMTAAPFWALVRNTIAFPDPFPFADANPLDQLQSAHFGHHPIGEHQRDRRLLEDLPGFDAVRRQNDLVPQPGEQARCPLTDWHGPALS
jgi:hypothetical protein